MPWIRSALSMPRRLVWSYTAPEVSPRPRERAGIHTSAVWFGPGRAVWVSHPGQVGPIPARPSRTRLRSVVRGVHALSQGPFVTTVVESPVCKPPVRSRLRFRAVTSGVEGSLETTFSLALLGTYTTAPGQSARRVSGVCHVLLTYWERRERGVVFSRPLRALRAA